MASFLFNEFLVLHSVVTSLVSRISNSSLRFLISTTLSLRKLRMWTLVAAVIAGDWECRHSCPCWLSTSSYSSASYFVLLDVCYFACNFYWLLINQWNNSFQQLILHFIIFSSEVFDFDYMLVDYVLSWCSRSFHIPSSNMRHYFIEEAFERWLENM